MASESSAKAGSKTLSGNGASTSPALRAESRNEDRDEGRSGVVGRDVRERELERLPPDSWNSVVIVVAVYFFAIIVSSLTWGRRVFDVAWRVDVELDVNK